MIFFAASEENQVDRLEIFQEIFQKIPFQVCH